MRKGAETVRTLCDAVFRIGGVGADLAFPVSKLADILGLERITPTRIADVMERDGLLSIVQGDDECVCKLNIAAKGKRVLAAALPAWRRVQKNPAFNTHFPLPGFHSFMRA